MNRLLDNRTASEEGSLNCLLANADKIKAIDALVEDTGQLKADLSDLRTAMRESDRIDLETSADKRKAESAVLDALAPVKNKMKSCAFKTGDTVMMKLAEVSVSEMRGMRDEDFLRFSQMIHAMVLDRFESFARFGLRREMIDALGSANSTFDIALRGISKNSGDKSNVLKRIDTLDTGITNLMKNSIDPLVWSMEQDEPAFVAEYSTTREVHDHGLRHRKPPTPPSPTTEG